MTFIETVPEAEARSPVAEMYEADRTALGHVANFTKAFSLRPDRCGALLLQQGPRRLGAQPDTKYADLDPQLQSALTVGRPLADP